MSKIRRKAFLAGFSYPNNSHTSEVPSRATINDVVHMRHFLMTECQHELSDITLFIDNFFQGSKIVSRFSFKRKREQEKQRRLMNRDKIIGNLLEMVLNARRGDRLFFMLAGHGQVSSDGSVRFVAGPNLDDTPSYMTGADLHRVLRLTSPDVKVTTFLVCCNSSFMIDETGAARQYPQQVAGSAADNLGVIFASSRHLCHVRYIPEWDCAMTHFMYSFLSVMKNKKKVTTNMKLVEKMDLFLKKFDENIKKRGGDDYDLVFEMERPFLYCSSHQAGLGFLK